MEKPCLFDKEMNAISLFWHPVKGIKAYEVQMKDKSGKWTTVAESLKCSLMRKKNLSPGQTYWFRVRGQDQYGWGEFSSASEPFTTLSQVPENQMDPPKLAISDGEALTLTWTAPNGATNFEVQYRSDIDTQDDWKFFLVGSTQITKALDQGRWYVFRIRPTIIDGMGTSYEWEQGKCGGPWRLMDTPAVYRSLLSQNITSGATFTGNGQPQAVSSLTGEFDSIPNRAGEVVPIRRLVGRVVGWFFGAQWCKKSALFANKLSRFYDDYRKDKPVDCPSFELIFVSLDNSASEMDSLLSTLPMKTFYIPYNDTRRQRVLTHFSTSQLPRLLVTGRDGSVVCQNAANGPLIPSNVFTWAGMNSAAAKTVQPLQNANGYRTNK